MQLIIRGKHQTICVGTGIGNVCMEKIPEAQALEVERQLWETEVSAFQSKYSASENATYRIAKYTHQLGNEYMLNTQDL